MHDKKPNRSPPASQQSAESSVIYLRVPDALLAEVDVYHATAQERAAVGVIVSRSAAVHQLIRDGLAVNTRKRDRSQR